MIVAKRKPFDEIMQLVKGHKKVLVVGCGTCVAVCLAGGEKEVAVLTTELDMGRKLANNPVQLGSITLERQCDREYLAQLDGMVKDYDALISMACGVGVQMAARIFAAKPVYPADAKKEGVQGLYVIDVVIGKGPSARSLRLSLKPFTVIGATTRAGRISSPLRDRFGATYRLDFYSDADLERVLDLMGVDTDLG